MSLLKCMERTVASQPRRKPEGRYDAWSRTESDHFREEVTRIICERDPSLKAAVCGLTFGRAYELFAALPEVEWGFRGDTFNIGLAMIRALFSKDEDMRSPIDTEGVAFCSFRAAEVACAETNRRLSCITDLPSDIARDVGAVIHAAQRKISQCLGEVPEISALRPSFGPGAAATCSKYTTARHKLSTPPSISDSAIGIASQLADGMPGWCRLHRRGLIVPGRVEFVPKNYKTKRSIVVEPSLTGCYQRAVGSAIKARLKRAGVNLYDQSINRERARHGSLTGVGNCTLDLKSASDTLAYGLVMELLPWEWFELLDSLRSDRVMTPDGRIMRLSKFSSMGNGYTFELESLIFWALGFGIASTFGHPFDLTVYGDDLICNEALARDIVKWFPWFGFKVNSEKSFITGSFRESCGGDYWLGVDVRPFFIRGRMNFHRVVTFYNHLCRKPHQDPDGNLRRYLLSQIPAKYKIFGPDGYGDGHLIDDRPLAEYLKPYGRQKGWEGYTFETYIEMPSRHDVEVLGDTALPAYQAYVNGRDAEEGRPCDRVAFDVRVPRGIRSYFLTSLVREVESGISEALDHYVVRKPSGFRVKGKRVRIYVLGAG